jgi:hypothetical protein
VLLGVLTWRCDEKQKDKEEEREANSRGGKPSKPEDVSSEKYLLECGFCWLESESFIRGNKEGVALLQVPELPSVAFSENSRN